VAAYRGKLIDALYTSTCGGLTEDASNVFVGRPEPYLKSTECIYEKQTEWTLEGPESLPIMAGNRNIDREVAWLVSLGLLPEGPRPEFYREPASVEEGLAWVRSAASFLGKPTDGLIPSRGAMDYPALAGLLVQAFQWEDRVRNLMLKSEVDFIMRDFPRYKGEARDNLAYLVHTGVLSSSPEMADETRPVTRGELALALWRSVRGYHDPARQGVFRGLVADGLQVEDGEELRVLRRSPDCFLFRRHEGEVMRASRLTLLGGEKVSWSERDGLVGLLEVEGVDEGNVLDRGSSYHSWQVRLTREELEKRIREYYPIGGLVDLEVTARGASRRVAALSVTGTESQVVVKGLKVRWVLGLRDTLFAIDREFGSGGEVSHFVFSGRGWGHGVGLCQVGAYRMAMAGAGYRDILKKYYKDIRVTKYY
jgi:stage II sporulation protein D